MHHMEYRGIMQFILLLIMVFCVQIKSQLTGSFPLAPALFVFGDSLSDNGNNNYINTIAKANFRPYGIDFPLGPTGRFCNGKTATDYLALFLGLPMPPAYLDPSTKGQKVMNGVNYASAAAGILAPTGRNYGARLSFDQQISNFKNTIQDITAQLGSTEAVSNFLSKSIFPLSFGSNDYINNFLQPQLYATSFIYSPQAYRDHLLQEYSRQLKELYALGAKKFVVSFLGPLGCIPQQLAAANSNGFCVQRVNDLIQDFNRGLGDMLNDLNNNLAGAKFIYQPSAYNTVLDTINNPATYGLRVVNEGCCGVGRFHGQLTCNPLVLPCSNRNEYVFWDAFHPTEAVNLILAQQAFDGGPAVVYPMNVRQLVQL